ncbi:ABC transporter substrate-binding protein [Cupriavidus alkaliphilus]|uniref:Peptide/nickel transport system permease protein/peptide/nickel transport system substrate-binding protein n=1 Tax=Cupriavidus alkaliphilus TaxID=942866 RepID=A0A7W4VE01_9BURK|nr:ABC transporter substrate-binding protein [Cupriavidus alkaliphilus]MBB3009875.1 peptide/nickel transport system permease protein/peptide/nickel transport system substrate-binding protein [Cupriavidus alkaliphilus]
MSQSSPSLSRCLAVCTVCLAAFLSACGKPAGDATAGNTLRVAFRAQNPGTLDPHNGTEGSEHVILWTIFATLLNFDPETLQPTPGLAASWRWVDGKTLRLKLVEGAIFQDGTPLDAAAVKFNLDRLVSAKATIAADLAAVSSVEASGTHEVTLHLKYPAASVLLALADRAGMMVSPTALERDPRGFGRNPVGAGPYRFVEWVSGDRIRVAKFDRYHVAGEPRLDGILFRLMPDPETRLNALRSGDVDLIYDVDPASLPTLQQQGNLQTVVSKSLAYFEMYINMAKPPFDQVKVRRALSMAIDRHALIAAVQQGHGEPAWSPMPSSEWAYTPAIANQPPYDVEQARRLLAEAGLPDGFAFKMAFEAGAINERRAEVIQAQLARIHVKVELLPSETAQAISRYLSGEVPVLNNRWTGRIDPAMTYAGQFSRNGFTNVGKHESPGLLAAMAQGESTTDLAQRARAYATVNRILLEEAFNIPLFFQAGIVAYDKRVQGFVPNLLSKPRFDGVSLSR